MSDQQKIWFIYLTDHHEGPFTPAEVAEKIGQGAVTPQSLGWKDGMPEWVPIESIPELNSALSAPLGSAEAPAAAAGGDEGFSLAQMLASQQGGGTPEAEGAALTMDIGDAPSDAGIGIGMGSQGAAPSASAKSEPIDPEDPIWTLKVAEHVSGLYSLHQLKTMAARGEVPASAMLWHSGWIDFQPVSSVPEVASARQDKPTGIGRGTQTSLTNPGLANAGTKSSIHTGMNHAPARAQSHAPAPAQQRPRGLTPITAEADIGNDDATDPGISRSGGGGFGEKLKGLFARKPSASSAKGKRGAAAASLKRLVPVLGGVLAVAAAGAAYVLFFSSPIPSDLDVLPDDLEVMNEVAKAPLASGVRFHAALARGTEDNPADDTSPKFYVATNLASGTAITLTLEGHLGTLVNRVSFGKAFTATVGDKPMAVFESLQDDGKPLPIGEYTMKISAPEGEPLILERFLGGKKSGVYHSRLAKYKEKLQGDYDKEMQVLRELIDTLKSLQGDASQRIREYNEGWQNVANRTKIANEWRAFSGNAQGMASQIDSKLKAYLGEPGQHFHPRAFQDIEAMLSKLMQLIQLHGERLAGKAPQAASPDSPDNLEGLVQAGVLTLDQWLAQAIVKNPFDVLNGGAGKPEPASPAPLAPPAQ